MMTCSPVFTMKRVVVECETVLSDKVRKLSFIGLYGQTKEPSRVWLLIVRSPKISHNYIFKPIFSRPIFTRLCCALLDLARSSVHVCSRSNYVGNKTKLRNPISASEIIF